MANKKVKLNQKQREWVEARQQRKLSHAQVQMARELGLNPTKLGQIDNHQQELWKLPLGQYIEHLYFKSFKKERPDVVLSIEEKARLDHEKKALKKEAKKERGPAAPDDENTTDR
ncbi:MAG: hypothetical protein V1816_25845 [Pseudomonadota bacterium]